MDCLEGKVDRSSFRRLRSSSSRSKYSEYMFKVGARGVSQGEECNLMQRYEGVNSDIYVRSIVRGK